MVNTILSLLIRDNFRLFFAAIATISIAALAAAFIAQALGFMPCQLCFYQRGIYGLLATISIAALITLQKYRLWLAAVALLQIASIAVSGYHVAIEMGFLPPLKLCSSHLNYAQMSIAQIKAALSATVMPDCSMPSLVILGVSMAGWNLCCSILLTMFTAILFKFANKY